MLAETEAWAARQKSGAARPVDNGFVDAGAGRNAEIRIESASPILAPAIGKLGYRLATLKQFADPLRLDANYVRRSDAEVSWIDRHGSAPVRLRSLSAPRKQRVRSRGRGASRPTTATTERHQNWVRDFQGDAVIRRFAGISAVILIAGVAGAFALSAANGNATAATSATGSDKSWIAKSNEYADLLDRDRRALARIRLACDGLKQYDERPDFGRYARRRTSPKLTSGAQPSRNSKSRWQKSQR